jgi:hypothetical protein
MSPSTEESDRNLVIALEQARQRSEGLKKELKEATVKLAAAKQGLLLIGARRLLYA